MTPPWQFVTMASTLGGSAPVKATCGCGRQTSPRMLYAVSGYTTVERAAKGWASDAEYVCDSCLSMGVRTGAILLSDLASKQSAPSDVLTALVTHETTFPQTS